MTRDDFKPDCFNLIDAGPGAGKTTFINERLHELFPEVPYENIMMAESRSLTAAMLDQSDSNFYRLYESDTETIRRLSGLPELNGGSVRDGISVLTYDKLVNMVAHNNAEGDIMAGVDIVVLDETHCLYTDTFISNIKAVSVWLKSLFSPDRVRRPLVIGLSATPDCFTELNQVEQNFPIHRVLDHKLVKYQAKHLICGTMNDIPEICRTRFRGKTIIMCETIEQCRTLARLLGNAAVLCSARSEHVTEEMCRIRRHIEANAELPPTYWNEERKVWEPLTYLIMTATGREGYNFMPHGGDGSLTDRDIKNVIVCFTDPMSIVQFAGRPRYDIPNLMVAMNPFGRKGTNIGTSFSKYQYKYRQSYLSFLQSDDRRGNLWFKELSPFLAEGINEVEVLHTFSEYQNMDSLLNSLQDDYYRMRTDSLVPVLTDRIAKWISDSDHEVRLYRDGAVKEIVLTAEHLGLLRGRSYSFRKVCNVLRRNGYFIGSGDEQFRADGKKKHRTYYVISRRAKSLSL